MQSLQAGPEGLTQPEAETRTRTSGPNEVAPERRQGWVLRLLKIIRNPLVVLLGALSTISFATGDARAGVVMAGMVVLSVALRFWQEARADAAATKLKAMIHVTATVLRDGSEREMPLRDLVAGDVIKLSAGDMIPADVRVISSKAYLSVRAHSPGSDCRWRSFMSLKKKPWPRRQSSRTSASWAQALKVAPPPQSWW